MKITARTVLSGSFVGLYIHIFTYWIHHDYERISLFLESAVPWLWRRDVKNW